MVRTDNRMWRPKACFNLANPCRTTSARYSVLHPQTKIEKGLKSNKRNNNNTTRKNRSSQNFAQRFPFSTHIKKKLKRIYQVNKNAVIDATHHHTKQNETSITFYSIYQENMNNNPTATNTPSEPLLCKMGCGFFVSSCSFSFFFRFFRWVLFCRDTSKKERGRFNSMFDSKPFLHCFIRWMKRSFKLFIPSLCVPFNSLVIRSFV